MKSDVSAQLRLHVCLPQGSARIVKVVDSFDKIFSYKKLFSMNKFYTLLLLSGVAVTANAQQISGSFDGDWNDCTPWTSDGNKKVVGTQPEGWHISNVYATGVKTVVGESVEGLNGNAVKLTNKSLMGQKIPGYITLGTPWATAETQLTNVRNADGGAYGGLKFTYHPDAISFDYKRDNSKGDENATVVAYLWNGTWTQKDVPGNTAVGVANYGTAKTVDMTDRDRNILGKETATGGDITHTEGATLVASLEQYVLATDEWTHTTIPFTYTEGNESATVENANVIFSATDYFGDRNNIVANNSLTIDNVKFEYYHSLSSLTTTDKDGNDVELNFSPDVYNYTVNTTYDRYYTDVNYEKVGAGASVDAEYNEETAQYVITVKGEDYDAETNPDAVTVYTIQYLMPAPVLSSLIVGGHEFIGLGKTDTEFTATGVYCPGEVSYNSDEDDVYVSNEYDETTGKLTITVSKKGAPSNVYTVTFEGNKKDAVYQIPNSDFEEWTTYGDAQDKLTTGWNSFDTATGLWAMFASMSPMPELIEGYEGNGVRLTSKDLFIAYANGNMTTGHINMGDTNPTAASNFNYTDRTDVDGNLPFAGTPDAFEVYARFTPGNAKEEGTALNGRVQLILHSDAAYHDPEVEEMEDAKIASASVIIPATEEWTKFTGEFNYVADSNADEKFLLASATTNPVPGASYDDKLDLDNLKLIYYHTLSAITLNGEPIDGFDPEKTDYVINGDIDEMGEFLDYVKKGRGGHVDEDWDMEDGVVTYTVYGDDYSVNPESTTTYTIKFDKPTGVGSISADEAKNHKVYTIGGVRVSGKPAAGLYIVDGKKMMVK